MSIDQLTQEALSLPNEFRLQLIEALLENFEPPMDEAIQSECLSEAKSRRDNIRNGLVKPIAGEGSLAQVRDLLT